MPVKKSFYPAKWQVSTFLRRALPQVFSRALPNSLVYVYIVKIQKQQFSEAAFKFIPVSKI